MHFFNKYHTPIIATLTFILGFTCAAVLLGQRVESRLEVGREQGHVSGAVEVIHFMNKHLDNELPQSNQIYRVKDIQVVPIEVKGVRTFEIIR